MRTGIAHLPLHGGKAPAWLFQRMKKLAREISLVIIKEHGTQEFLNRLSDPFWFQAFGCVLGFDWHSSGLTTTSCGALKEGLKDIYGEVGLYVCGGKGRVSRRTPQEIEAVGFKRGVNVDPQKLVYASRMAAKVDSSALQDNYDLYQHVFIFNREGNWAVIQQGMNTLTRWARRYHWAGDKVLDFVREPHAAVCCDHKGHVLNMVDRESGGCREVSAGIASDNPDKVVKEFIKVRCLDMPAHHAVYKADIRPDNLKKILMKTYEKQPENFEQLLSIEGVGPKTVRALSLMSELVYGKPAAFKDPVRFSFAHGGKDGHPFPVDRQVYDSSIKLLHDALKCAKVDYSDKIKSFRRLHEYYK